VLAPSRRSDKPPSGALDSGHVTVAIMSAIPGSVYMLTENFIDEEIRCLRWFTPCSSKHLKQSVLLTGSRN